MANDELVLVIPTTCLHQAGYFQGYRASNPSLVSAILQPKQYQFLPRSKVETDPTFKQLIPYVVLRSGDLFFHYRRGANGSEQRLRALRSLGIGGHINDTDCRDSTDPYAVGMLRELHEEVQLPQHGTARLLGFINDDRTPVGSVHLGIVHVLDLDSPVATARESSIADAGFASLPQLVNSIGEFESWSQLILQELIRESNEPTVTV